jgi:hypothetical protein
VQLFAEPQAVTAGACGRHVVACLAQVVFKDGQNVLFVFDNEYSGHPVCSVSGGCDDSVTAVY